MARFEIISKDGSIVRYSGKPRYNGSYLKPSFLEFSEIASPVPISWEVGDYVDYPRTGMRYRLYSIPQASKNARKDSHGRAFTYSNVQLHAATKELEIALFRDLVSNDNNIHFSTSPDVATFEDVYGIARRIQACMDDLYPGRWEIRVADFDESEDAEIIEKISEAKDFALSGGTCLDALSKIYELWQDIGWIHSYENGKEVVTIGYANKRITDNTSDAYLYGKGNGLTAIKKNQTNKDEFATRLYVYGSERNLPSRYYNGLDILNAESVDIRNLMLPLDSWGQTNGLPDARKAYLENSDAVAKFGVIPKTHYFDSTDAGADIYPSIEGMTIGQIRKVLSDMGETEYSPSVDIYPNDSERADEIIASPPVTDNGIIKKNGKAHDVYQSGSVLPYNLKGDTIPVGANGEIIILNGYEIWNSDHEIDGTYRAKVTYRPNYSWEITKNDYISVWAVFTMYDGSVVKKSVKTGASFDDSTNKWVIVTPTISADYTDASYLRYRSRITVTIYAEVQDVSGEIFPMISTTSGKFQFYIDAILDKTFIIRIKQVGFDINEMASQGEGKTISLKSGSCEGRNFIISNAEYVSERDWWNLTCKRQQDDTLGMLFPNRDYKIESGDRFVLLDIAMPESYIRVAKERLLAEGSKFLSRASRVQSHYEPAIDAKVMVESGRTLREGMFMEITDEDVIDNTTEHILIDTLSIYEDESAIPTYKVTLRERRKVTYKGTPSATSTTSTKSVEEDVANEDVVVDLSNYYTKEEVNELIDEVAAGDVDLTNYYTKGEIDGKGFLTSASLVGYAKTTEVAETYATKIALSAVDGRLISLESYFSTSEDADTQINKWNEIVAFLNATEGTTLAGILAAYYTKTEVDGKVTAINNSITALDDKYAPVKTWYDALASLIVKDGTNVRIKTNLIVEGDTASGGTGGGAAIGVTGILVDGKQYTDTDSDGYIDLSGAFAGLSPTITSAMITEALGYAPANSASLGSLAYLNSLSKSDVGLGNVDNLAASGYLTALSSDTTNAVSITVGGTTKNITVTAMKTSLGLGSLATKDSLVASDIPSLDWSKITSGKPTTLAGYGITDAYTASATDTKLSGYLPLTGGTLSANGSDIFVINRLNSTSPTTITYRKDGSLLGRMGFNTDGAPVAQVGGTYQTLIHSGNIGSQNVNYATSAGNAGTLGNISSTGFAFIGGYPTASTNNWSIQSGFYRTAANSAGLPLSNNGNHVIHCNWDGNAANQIFLSYASDLMAFRRKADNVWKDWKTIAFTDSNVASATKLLDDTAFTIWGKTFFEGGKPKSVDGDIVIHGAMVGKNASNAYESFMGNASGGINGGDGALMYAYGSRSLYFYTDYTQRMLINPSGKITIGKTDLASTITDTILYVDGGIRFAPRTIWGQSFDGTGNVSGNLTLANDTPIDVTLVSGITASVLYLSSANVVQIGYGTALIGADTIISGENLQLRYSTSRKVGLLLNSSGNVTIGDSDLAGTDYKLYVAGTGRFTGAVTMSSTLSVTGTLSAKGSIEVYGSTPYIDFHFGNATDDYTSRIIEIASGNLAVYANWLPNTNNAKKLGNSDRRWSEIFGVNGNLSGTLNVGGASTFNGDVRINGNLVVTGDTASGGTGENNVGGNLRVDYDAMWALINKTSITQAEMDAVGFTTEVVDNITIGVYNKIVGESGAYKYVYNYECRDLDGSIHLHIYFGDDNIDNCERFYFERSDAGTWTLNFYEV